MRVTLFTLLFFAFFAAILWVTLTGIPLLMGALIWLLIVFISIGYYDTVVLFLLGAREVRSSDEEEFFQAASQQAYKLAVPMAHLYFYNGTLERAYVLQHRQHVSIVLSKSLLEKCSKEELNAICFELFLQVKKGMASKRTKAMFLLGSISWLLHSLVGLILKIVPKKEVKQVSNWLLNYFLSPVMDVLFKILLGGIYFKRLENLLMTFPDEKEMLSKVGLKLRKPATYYSLTSRKLLELSSLGKSGHFQSIMALEFLPHEWDYLFDRQEIMSAE